MQDDDAIWAIVYVSTAAYAMSRNDLEFLLVEGRRLNNQDAITGVLLFGGGNLMQYFEGPRPAVTSTFDRIKASRRHHDIFVVLNEQVAERSFTGWDMGLVEASQSEQLKLSTANWTRESEPGGPRLSEPVGLTLLKQFWDNNKRG